MNIFTNLTSDSRGAPGLPVGSTAPAPATEIGRIWNLPGLCWNASVMTSFGALPAQVLRLHDPLRLSDGNVARIAWVDKIQLDEDFLAAFPDAQPVMIRAGALGPGLPAQDTLVSPHQQIAFAGPGMATSVKLARDLLDRPGILRQVQTMVTYHLFHCGKPATILVDGMTLHTTP